jgi:hypothetical protein
MPDSDCDPDSDPDNAFPAALSGAQVKATGFACGYLLDPAAHRDMRQNLAVPGCRLLR